MRCWLTLIMGLATLTGFSVAAFARDSSAWIGTWQASPAGLPSTAKLGALTLPSRSTVKGTVRYRLRISRGGTQIRLRFSNEYGDTPFALTAVTVGLAAAGLNAAPGSLRKVTFGGKETLIVPAGAPALSDAIALRVADFADLVVSVYLRDGMTAFDCGSDTAPTDQAVIEGADATLAEPLSTGKCFFTFRPLISAVDVFAHSPHQVIVALGDSITDGVVDAQTAERGWPDVLSRRLRGTGISVVNAGIGGNRLLESLPGFGASSLSRFDRDVLAVPGLRYIVVLEGINDIRMSGSGGVFGDTPPVSPESLIGAYRQLAARAHERGVKLIGATLTPFGGARFHTPEREKARASINAWIRATKELDAMIDFDAALRDPVDREQLKPDYDSGDHLHPNAAGYRRMGEMIDLHLFTPVSRSAAVMVPAGARP